MCRLRNIAMRDYQESVTSGQTDTHRRTDGQTPDKVIPMCRYASQATQKLGESTQSIVYVATFQFLRDKCSSFRTLESRKGPRSFLCTQLSALLSSEKLESQHYN